MIAVAANGETQHLERCIQDHNKESGTHQNKRNEITGSKPGAVHTMEQKNNRKRCSRRVDLDQDERGDDSQTSLQTQILSGLCPGAVFVTPENRRFSSEIRFAIDSSIGLREMKISLQLRERFQARQPLSRQPHSWN